MISVGLTSLETRYKFSAIQLGILASAYDTAIVLTVIFISYFGGKGNKPRWLGAGLFLEGFGALLFASPQFITGEYDVGNSVNSTLEACEDPNNFAADCGESSSVYYLFILAYFIIGIGSVPIFTLGTSYIDDIIHPKHVPIWLGIFYTAALFGPALGFGISGAFLKVYVDPWKDTTLKETDPGWVGAWWMGFILCGMIAIMVSILFFMFPKKYPDTDAIKKERVKLASIQRKKTVTEEDLKVRYQIKELPKQIANLLGRVPYLCVTLVYALQAFSVAGFFIFTAKYMESQYGLTPSTSGFIAGAIGIPVGVGLMMGMPYIIIATII